MCAMRLFVKEMSPYYAAFLDMHKHEDEKRVQSASQPRRAFFFSSFVMLHEALHFACVSVCVYLYLSVSPCIGVCDRADS